MSVKSIIFHAHLQNHGFDTLILFVAEIDEYALHRLGKQGNLPKPAHNRWRG